MRLLLFLSLLLLDHSVSAQNVQIQEPKHDPIAVTRGLIQRRLGDQYNEQISLRLIDKDADGLDVFEIGTHADQVEIAGSSGTTMAYALQWYLKTSVGTQTDWDNHPLTLPPQLPSVPSRIRQKRADKYTYYQNVCTVSYSTWSWGWDEWEKHIDWMALNGINLPLAFTGQEYVWQKVFQNEFHVSDQGLNKFFAGSAFLAWGRMGNVRGSWGPYGPLPQAFIDNQYNLQKKILARMKTFGMIPALPAFAGHVPEELVYKYPNASFTRSPNWNNFPPEHCCVYMLQPSDPLYEEIGKAFIRVQKEVYDYTSSVYQCDTYNEMDPDTTDTGELMQASQAVYESMRKQDPEAIWLMQGWLFISEYWTSERVEAYLSGVPDTNMIILDLYSEVQPIWKKMDNYFGKSWIYCVLHNFGGATGMRGDLLTIASDPVVSRHESNGTMIGMGLTMEGIFQNYIVYDLSLQMAWQEEAVNAKTYVTNYAARRYHVLNDMALAAWDVLGQSVYNCTKGYGGVTKNIVMLIPHWHLDRSGFMPTTLCYDPLQVVHAYQLMIRAAKDTALTSNKAFRHDVVDVARQFLSDSLLTAYVKLKELYFNQTSTAHAVCLQKDRMLQLISDLDVLLSTNEDFLLGHWIQDAKDMAKMDGNTNMMSLSDASTLEAYYEYEARNQVTRWGENNNETVHDYAGKEWGGLVRGYYIERWRIWLSEVCEAKMQEREMNVTSATMARRAFEKKWQVGREAYPTTEIGDSIEVAARLYQDYISTTSGWWSWDQSNVADNQTDPSAATS